MSAAGFIFHWRATLENRDAHFHLGLHFCRCHRCHQRTSFELPSGASECRIRDDGRSYVTEAVAYTVAVNCRWVACLSGAEFSLISPMRVTQLPQSQIESSITFYAICSESAANSRIGSGADPPDLPRPALFERRRAPRKEIRSKPLRSLNSGLGKQVITGERRRIGDDFRHQRGSVKTRPTYWFMMRSHQGRRPGEAQRNPQSVRDARWYNRRRRSRFIALVRNISFDRQPVIAAVRR